MTEWLSKLFFQKTENNENFDSNPVCKMTVDSTCRPVIIRDLRNFRLFSKNRENNKHIIANNPNNQNKQQQRGPVETIYSIHSIPTMNKNQAKK